MRDLSEFSDIVERLEWRLECLEKRCENLEIENQELREQIKSLQRNGGAHTTAERSASAK
jgi:chaperonin cofactor prefoldin